MDQNRIKQIRDKTDIRSWVIHFFCRVLGVGKEQLNLHILVGSGIETDFLPDYTQEYGLQLGRKLCRFHVNKEFVFL